MLLLSALVPKKFATSINDISIIKMTRKTPSIATINCNKEITERIDAPVLGFEYGLGSLLLLYRLKKAAVINIGKIIENPTEKSFTVIAKASMSLTLSNELRFDSIIIDVIRSVEKNEDMKVKMTLTRLNIAMASTIGLLKYSLIILMFRA